uniref:Uncharacterized protein n=1 Tax=Hippocampus comes TaxID=109280 RepID=A0A3Q2XQ23_HIPCM
MLNFSSPKATGTTIVGIKYRSGIVLCSDTRATNGPTIWCCGAGTAPDTERVCRMASKHMNLFKYKYLKRPLVSHCNRIIQDYLF